MKYIPLILLCAACSRVEERRTEKPYFPTESEASLIASAAEAGWVIRDCGYPQEAVDYLMSNILRSNMSVSASFTSMKSNFKTMPAPELSSVLIISNASGTNITIEVPYKK